MVLVLVLLGGGVSGIGGDDCGGGVSICSGVNMVQKGGTTSITPA